MSIPEYGKEKYYRIMDMAQMNYANQYKRLSRNEKRGNFILIYYSLALIIYGISTQFYPNIFDGTWMTYCSTILSVIVLVYSIINSKADYANRAASIARALNEVKRMKRDVGAIKDDKAVDGIQKLNELKIEYDRLVSSTEVRDDIDFYYTVLSLCDKYDINPYTKEKKRRYDPNKMEPTDEVKNEIKGYLAENRPCKQLAHVCFLSFWHLLLYVAPVIIFILGISSLIFK